MTSGPGCDRDIPFAQVAALTLFSLGVTIGKTHHLSSH